MESYVAKGKDSAHTESWNRTNDFRSNQVVARCDVRWYSEPIMSTIVLHTKLNKDQAIDYT